MRTRRALAAVWLAAAVGLGAMLASTQASYGRLDDRDPARQRPGLIDARPLPSLAPSVTPSVPRRGRRAVVFFVRTAQRSPLELAVLVDVELRRLSDVVVVSGGPASGTASGIAPARSPNGTAPAPQVALANPKGQSSAVALEPSGSDSMLVPEAVDSDGALARAFGMPRPRDGGPAVGYAVVDRSGRVRYATLDPQLATEAGLREVLTMVRATP